MRNVAVHFISEICGHLFHQVRVFTRSGGFWLSLLLWLVRSDLGIYQGVYANSFFSVLGQRAAWPFSHHSQFRLDGMLGVP